MADYPHKEPFNNIFRGPARVTTSESLEVVDEAIADLLPGTITDAKGAPLTAFDDGPCYIAQEQLYGSVDEATTGSARLLLLKSGDLFAVRCVAGQTIGRDQPLAISATPGYVTAAVSGDASPLLYAEYALDGVTTAGQLIPVRVK